jgi:hypothetical protein
VVGAVRRKCTRARFADKDSACEMQLRTYQLRCSQRETGIGAWSDDEFVAALRNGKSEGGRLYPGMPYTYIRNSWGNAAGAVSASDVRQWRQQLSQPD